MDRTTGKVKWFSQVKGYGFIEQDEGPDIFVHYSSIEGNGFRTLSEGDRVEFDVQQQEQGLKARNVVRLESERGASPAAEAG